MWSACGCFLFVSTALYRPGAEGREPQECNYSYLIDILISSKGYYLIIITQEIIPKLNNKYLIPMDNMFSL